MDVLEPKVREIVKVMCLRSIFVVGYKLYRKIWHTRSKRLYSTSDFICGWFVSTFYKRRKIGNHMLS